MWWSAKLLVKNPLVLSTVFGSCSSFNGNTLGEFFKVHTFLTVILPIPGSLTVRLQSLENSLVTFFGNSQKMMFFHMAFICGKLVASVFGKSQLSSPWLSKRGVFRWKTHRGRLIEKIKDQVSEDEAGKAFGMMEDWKGDEMSLECVFLDFSKLFIKDWYHWYRYIRYSWGLGMGSNWRKGGLPNLKYDENLMLNATGSIIRHLSTAFSATLTNKGWKYEPVFMIGRCSNIHLDWSIVVFQLGIPGINAPRYPMIY